MDLPSLLRIYISMAVSLVFLVSLCGSYVSASKADAEPPKDVGVLTQGASQALSDGPKTMPTTPGDVGSMAAPLPVRTDNPVACYTTCVIGCNPRQGPPVRPCQKRCANHCWKE